MSVITSQSALTRAKNRLSKDLRQHPIDAVGIDKSGNYIYPNDVKIKNKKEKTPTTISIKTLADFNYDDNFFIPMQSGEAIDGVFSRVGGILPATNYIVIGDAGTGKTTTMMLFSAKVANTGKKVAFFSAEMSPMDLKFYSKNFPILNNLQSVYTSEEFAKNEDFDVFEGLEMLVNMGFDLILIDSLAEVIASIKVQRNWSSNECEKRLVDLFIKGNTNSMTSFIIIQQVTKGGNFVGSNKLKHNTTGMIELRYDKVGNTYFGVMKNRRGFKYDTLYYTLKDNKLYYDVEKAELDLKTSELIENNSKFLANETQAFLENLGSSNAVQSFELDETSTEVSEFQAVAFLEDFETFDDVEKLIINQDDF